MLLLDAWSRNELAKSFRDFRPLKMLLRSLLSKKTLRLCIMNTLRSMCQWFSIFLGFLPTTSDRLHVNDRTHSETLDPLKMYLKGLFPEKLFANASYIPYIVRMDYFRFFSDRYRLWLSLWGRPNSSGDSRPLENAFKGSAPEKSL